MRTYRKTDMKKLKVDLRNCAKVPYDTILKCSACLWNKYSVGELVITIKLLPLDERWAQRLFRRCLGERNCRIFNEEKLGQWLRGLSTFIENRSQAVHRDPKYQV
jgi:hypothetical protein